jgi:hypothetical protein
MYALQACFHPAQPNLMFHRSSSVTSGRNSSALVWVPASQVISHAEERFPGRARPSASVPGCGAQIATYGSCMSAVPHHEEGWGAGAHGTLFRQPDAQPEFQILLLTEVYTTRPLATDAAGGLERHDRACLGWCPGLRPTATEASHTHNGLCDVRRKAHTFLPR